MLFYFCKYISFSKCAGFCARIIIKKTYSHTHRHTHAHSEKERVPLETVFHQAKPRHTTSHSYTTHIILYLHLSAPVPHCRQSVLAPEIYTQSESSPPPIHSASIPHIAEPRKRSMLNARAADTLSPPPLPLPRFPAISLDTRSPFSQASPSHPPQLAHLCMFRIWQDDICTKGTQVWCGTPASHSTSFDSVTCPMWPFFHRVT